MTDLATLANWAELVGAAVVIGGVVFAVVEIRNLQRQRLEAAAMELVHEWFQWLAERIEALPEFQSGSPAYVAGRDWRP